MKVLTEEHHDAMESRYFEERDSFWFTPVGSMELIKMLAVEFDVTYNSARIFLTRDNEMRVNGVRWTDVVKAELIARYLEEFAILLTEEPDLLEGGSEKIVETLSQEFNTSKCEVRIILTKYKAYWKILPVNDEKGYRIIAAYLEDLSALYTGMSYLAWTQGAQDIASTKLIQDIAQEFNRSISDVRSILTRSGATRNG
jgi:hypothetical protein